MTFLRSRVCAILALGVLISSVAQGVEDRFVHSSVANRPLGDYGVSSSFNFDGAAASEIAAGGIPSPISRGADVLGGLRADAPVRTRGIKGMAIYRNLSPSVVLVATDSSLGSGSLVSKQGDVLTNWHVIKDAETIAIIFKPKMEGAKLSKSDLRRATVVRIDEVADLALLRVAEVPSGVEPVKLGDISEISVGSDVHAIGHPTGEAWTYTRGVISQFRRDYSWTTGDTQRKHNADVIQTQTPINPGNSGGPLIGDSGRLLGVNSFKGQGEGLNYAVSVEEVQRFLRRPDSRMAESLGGGKAASTSRQCEVKERFRGRNSAGNGFLLVFDTDCTGTGDTEIRVPDDKQEPVVLVQDRNGDGRPDVAIFDTDRDGKWEFSFWDNNFDGKWDLVGAHPDGTVTASRFERYDVVIAKSAR